MNKIELIHRDFDTAVEVLVKIAERKQLSAKQMNEPKPEEDYEDGKFLKSIGFSSTEIAIKADAFDFSKGKIITIKNANEEEAKVIQQLIQKYQKIFPFHKFILYSQVLAICEKYNLYLAPAGLYKGEIPRKNIEELKKFDFKTFENNKILPSLKTSEPICVQDLNSYEYNSYYSSTQGHKPSTYICAPLNDFVQRDDVLRIGKELYIDSDVNHSLKKWVKFESERVAPKDPIILHPVKAFELKQIGFIVITKWGIEANDEALQVGLNN